MDEWSPPRLLRTETWEEVALYDGHQYDADFLCFAADGKTLRTVGSDGMVCVWDARDLKMLRRMRLPEGYILGSVRETDGRFALCIADDNPKQPAKVLDLDTCRVVSEVVLPTGSISTIDGEIATPVHLAWPFSGWPGWRSRGSQLFWLDDQNAMFLDFRNEQWHRFNYRNGKILAHGSVDGDRRLPTFDIKPGRHRSSVAIPRTPARPP